MKTISAVLIAAIAIWPSFSHARSLSFPNAGIVAAVHIDPEISLQAQSHEKSNVISWRLPVESSWEIVTLERSANGLDFEPIKTYTISRKMTTGKFVYVDREGQNVINYYRLKLEPVSGNVLYSDVAFIKSEREGATLDKLKGQPSFVISTIDNWWSARLTLYDRYGTKVLQTVSRTSRIDLATGLAAGSYSYILELDEQKYSGEISCD